MMHYFKRNIGDYHKKAGRLNMLQHGAYTLLIDSCYDRERFPTRDEAIEWCWASSQAEIDAVDFVLSRFFELVDGRYIQTRIVEEIAEYHGKSEKNKQIAIEREAKRKEARARNVHDACTNEHETPPNHKPITNNHKPITNKKTKDKPNAPAKAVAVLVPKQSPLDLLMAVSGMTEQVAKDHLAVRKAKKSPLTETALALIAKEADKAGITTAQAVAISTARGWVSFKADWIRPDDNQKTHAERTQDFKDQQAAKAYAPLLNASQETLAKWGLISND